MAFKSLLRQGQILFYVFNSPHHPQELELKGYAELFDRLALAYLGGCVG